MYSSPCPIPFSPVTLLSPAPVHDLPAPAPDTLTRSLPVLLLAQGYYGIAIGKGKQAAKTEVEKLKLDELTCKDALFEVAKIIHSVHDEVKDKDFELDLSWICEASGYRHQLVPADLVADAETRAKAALEEDDMEDD
eukprot:TRINITY_DN1203_c0_g1_i1.p2 TRINITY_DN1203_c0_g1~~TRINITY_DN1203_c0_g1_i1.p2  ORF type:complete len:137 (-),score=49.97 TRINITY_DN1203_c0_g1_i1:85-495(-)